MKKNARELNVALIIALIIAALGAFVILFSDESRIPIGMKGGSLKHDKGYVKDDYIYINDEIAQGYGGPFARMDRYALNKGTYSINLEYFSDLDGNLLSVIDDGKYILMEELPAVTEGDRAVKTVEFTLDQDSQETIIQLSYIGTGALYAYSVELSPMDGFYNDSCYFAVIWVISVALLTFLYIRCKRKQVKADRLFTVLVLAAIGVFSFIPYMNGELPWGDDLCYHLIRIEGIKDGLSDGRLPVMIYPEGLNGYGYLGTMYPSLFLYIPALIRLFGVSIAASYKTLIFIFALATPFLTYISVKGIYKGKYSGHAAILAAAVYTVCPYRYTNLYARGALGEALAMTFVPLLIWGLYELVLGDKKKWWVIVIALSGLFETHVLSSLLGVILCIVTALVFIVKLIKEKRFIEIGKAALLFILLNLWQIVPFVYFYAKGGLWMEMLGISRYGEYSLKASSLIGSYNSEGYRLLSLGIPLCILGALSVINIIIGKTSEDTEDKRSFNYRTILVVVSLVCFVIMLGSFRAWKFMECGVIKWFFENVQFPWRFLGPVSLIFAMTGSIALFEIPVKSIEKSGICVMAILIILSLAMTARYEDDDFAYESYASTYTNGHYSKIIGIPKGDNTIVYPYEWRKEGITDDILTPDLVRVSEPDASLLSEYERRGTDSEYSYILSEDDVTIELPTVFYKGYVLEDENGNEIEIRGGEHNLVTFTGIGDGEKHTVYLSYHKGFLNTISFVISVISLLGSVSLLIMSGRKTRIISEKENQ